MLHFKTEADSKIYIGENLTIHVRYVEKEIGKIVIAAYLNDKCIIKTMTMVKNKEYKIYDGVYLTLEDIPHNNRCKLGVEAKREYSIVRENNKRFHACYGVFA